MRPEDFLAQMASSGDRCALLTGGRCYTYRELWEAVQKHPPIHHRVIGLAGGFSFANVVTLLRAWCEGSVVALLGRNDAKRVEICAAEAVFQNGLFHTASGKADHPLYRELEGQAGVVIFTSGSGGEPKAVLHRVAPYLSKVCRPGKSQRTLAFLSFDHIGGLNTLLYAFAHEGAVVVPNDRTPSTVWKAIQDHEVELLPTTPSFLRLALLEGEIPALPSLKLIAYGSEPMPEATLLAVRAAFPGVELLQQYGMSELGVLRSRSRDSESNWVRIGGEEFSWRVVDGLLEIRADTAMVGYLNAPSPFTPDGWLRTGDEAEQDGEWLRIRGRRSEVINVGGEKVHPGDVESALEAMPNVVQALVRGEANSLMGQVVVAAVQLANDEPMEQFRVRMRVELRGKLPRYAIPARVETLANTTSERFKKIRRQAA